MEDPHVVIIGGGFGGLQAAKRLANKAVQVTLIDRENHHLFQPLLYQVATAGLSPGSIAIPIRSVLGRYKNIRVLLGEVTHADFDRKKASLANGSELRYDYLIIAAGAKTNYFGNDGWAVHAHALKSLRDAIRIRERILVAFETAEHESDSHKRSALLTYVVIGGGPTGVEMAGAIAELGKRVLAKDYQNISPEDIRVLLVEMAPRVLTPFKPELSQSAREQLEDLGVDVRVGQRVTDVTDQGVRIGDEFVPSAVVTWATGVRGESLVDKLNLKTDRGNRVVVDQHCATLGYSDVFAIGDVARFVPHDSEQPLPGVAPVAMQQGRYVADTIVQELRRRPRKPFRYVDKGMMATIGRRRAVAQADWLPPLDGLMAWFAWCLVHLLFLIGFRNRVIVLFEWIWSYFTFARGARLITAHIRPKPRTDTAPDPLDVVGERESRYFRADP